MASCKDCINYDACKVAKLNASNDVESWCDLFKDHLRFIELPNVGNYDIVTTIDEAIDHCYQIATSTDETVCAECKAEHMRLCGWLGDLKRRIVAEQALNPWEEYDG